MGGFFEGGAATDAEVDAKVATHAALTITHGAPTEVEDAAAAQAKANAAAAASIPLAQKAAASGVASLTAGSVVVEQPAAHSTAKLTSGTLPIARGGTAGTTAALARVALEVGYQDEIHVAKTGGMYTTIQAAVNVAGAGTKTLIVIHPGTYAETVDLSGKPLVELRGVATRGGEVIVSGAAGVLLTHDTGTAGTTVSGIRFASTGAQCVLIPAGAAITDTYRFLDCVFSCTIAAAAMTNGVIQVASGIARFQACGMSYTMTGTTGGAGPHRMIYVSGAATAIGKVVTCTMNIADPGGTVVFLEENSAVVVESLWHVCQIEIVTGATWTGLAGIYYALGAGSDKHFHNCHLHITSGNAGVGTIYGILMVGTGGEAHSTGNHYMLLDGANNYPWVIAGGDTIHSMGDDIIADTVPLIPGATQYYSSMFNNVFKSNTMEIHAPLDQTKIVTVDASGATTGKTATLVVSHTDNRSIALPDSSDMLAVSGATKSRGASYLTGTGAVATPSAGTWYDWAGTFTGADLVDFTQSGGVLTYTGTPTKVFPVHVNLYMRGGGTNGTGNKQLGISVNNATPAAQNTRPIRLSGTSSTGSIDGMVTLATGNTVRVKILAVAGVDGSTLAYFDLVCGMTVVE